MEQLMERRVGKPRLAWIDNLRWLVIVMVVLIHVCATYSGIGSWYYHEEAQLDAPSLAVFFAYESFSQAFFMGFLFLLAGYFVPRAYDRKGFGRFALDRLVRLGVPTAVFMFILHPLTELIKKAFLKPPLLAADIAGFFKWYIGNRIFFRETGPLWFALALLVFCLVYGLVRRAGEALGARRAGERGAVRPVSHGLVAVLIVIMAVASFLVRLVQPFGTSWYNMQLCFFPQYIILFLIGLWSARSGFLANVPYRFGMFWFRLALAAGIPVWAALLGLGGAFSGNEAALLGGLHWQAAGYALWEAFFCVGISLGLIVLYRERVNVRGRLTGFLADNNFGVYVFHTPILVAVSLALRAQAAQPLAKTLVVSALVLPACFLVAALVRRVPGLRRLFS
jgi:surface polysaccharide O-acyltransferase-like enzyme